MGFSYTWADIVKHYGKFEELLDYISNEFKNYYINTVDSNSMKKFASYHKYITHALLKGISSNTIRERAGLRKIRHSKLDCINNMKKIRDRLGHVPMYQEFHELSNISLTCYKGKFKTGKYDDMVKEIFPEEFKEYETMKRKHKSEVSKINCVTNKEILSKKDLEKEFIRVFDIFYDQYKEYPSRNIFNKVSNHDESTYRKKFNMSWLEVCEHFGYKVENKNTAEKICLDKISIILNAEYQPQKTWEWLIGTNKSYLFCDGYFPQYKLVVEFDGRQHYEPVEKFGGEKAFKILQKNDKCKDELIPKHGLKILRIDAREDWFNDNYLKSKLEEIIKICS